MSRGSRKSLVWTLAAAAALPVLLISAVPAAASTWTVRQLGGEAARATMFGVSCPGTSLCVAVGSDNTVASSTDPTGPAASWNAVYVGAGTTVTQGAANQREIKGVSCPSTQLCVAVSYEGLVYTSTDPTGPASAWAVTALGGEGPNTHLYGVSCPTTSLCVASAGGGRILTSTDPTGGAAAWSVTQLAEPLELRGVSCASPSLCVVVGARGGSRPESTDVGQVLSATAPLTGPWRQVEPVGTEGDYFGVSCVGTSLCLSGDATGRLLLSTNPTGAASAWSTAPGGATVQITAANCPSASRCLVVDNNGDAITSTDPTAAGSWELTKVAPYPGPEEATGNAMFGASCPSGTLCAAVGTDGQIFTSADPFAESVQPVVKKKSARHRRRPKRPRVRITGAPPPGVEIKGHSTKVLFRFLVPNHARVRGYVCKLDQRPLRRCRPPKHYRVGLGRHVFRVRAIGWTGLRGPLEVRRFKVCHPTRIGSCIRGAPLTLRAAPPEPLSGPDFEAQVDPTR